MTERPIVIRPFGIAGPREHEYDALNRHFNRARAAMLGINKALGFEPYLSRCVWQLETDKARAYLARTAPNNRRLIEPLPRT